MLIGLPLAFFVVPLFLGAPSVAAVPAALQVPAAPAPGTADLLLSLRAPIDDARLDELHQRVEQALLGALESSLAAGVQVTGRPRRSFRVETMFSALQATYTTLSMSADPTTAQPWFDAAACAENANTVVLPLLAPHLERSASVRCELRCTSPDGSATAGVRFEVRDGAPLFVAFDAPDQGSNAAPEQP